MRPCSAIFGPEDNFITRKWLDQGSVVLVMPDSRIDWVHVENVTWGLLERALLERPREVGGQPFCISNEQPMSGADFYARLGAFYRAQMSQSFGFTHLPTMLMYAIAFLIKSVQWLTRGAIKGEAAQLTPAMFHTALMSYAFSTKRAAEVLGYRPLFTVDEGLQRKVSQ